MVQTMRVVVVAALCGLICGSTALGQALDPCGVIITSGLREYRIGTSSDAYLNTVFDRFCETSGTTRSQGGALGVEFPLKSIPVSLTGNYSSSEEGYRTFCKTYASRTTTNSSRYTYEERIVEKAYETYAQCRALSVSGVSISHNTLDRATVSINLRAAVGKPLEVRGLRTSQGITCSGISPDGKPVSYTPSTVVRTTDYLRINCSREPRTRQNDTKVFDEGTIQVGLNAEPGGYDVYLPRDEFVPEVSAMEIQKRLATIDTHLAGKLDIDKWPSGRYVILRGSGEACPKGFKQVDTFVHAIASFLPDPGQGDPAGYIRQADFGASSIKCHGGANCGAYGRPAPVNINWLANLDLSFCVKE